MTERNRRLLWLASVIVAFILGYLLGRRLCERERSGGAGGGVVLGAPGSGAPGAPAHINPGTGQGDTKGGGGYLKVPVDTTIGGVGGGAGGGGGEAGGGGGGGNGAIPRDSGEYKKKPNPVDTLSTGFVANLAEDKLTGRSAKDPPAPPDPRITTKAADDFSLDQTALPRFPMDVTRAFSAVSTQSDLPADTGTSTAFATTDSFDSVTSWYRHHMPPGSHEANIDVNRMAALAKQLTPQNIMKMIMPQNGSPTTIDTAAADSAPPGARLSGWELPDDGTHGKRTVTVMSSPGKPTTIIMSRSRRP